MTSCSFESENGHIHFNIKIYVEKNVKNHDVFHFILNVTRKQLRNSLQIRVWDSSTRVYTSWCISFSPTPTFRCTPRLSHTWCRPGLSYTCRCGTVFVLHLQVSDTARRVLCVLNQRCGTNAVPSIQTNVTTHFLAISEALQTSTPPSLPSLPFIRN